MAGIEGSQSVEILLEVLPQGGSTAAAYRLVPAWEFCFDGGRAAVPSTEATVSATLAAPAVPTPTAPLVDSLVLLVTCAEHTSSISLVPERDITDEEAGGNCSMALQIYPCEDRAAIRMFDLQGSQKTWKSTVLFSLSKAPAHESQLFSIEQIFGKEVITFHATNCQDLPFPPFRVNFANDFKVLKKIGQGTEGNVSKCSSKFTDFKCAVKEVVPANFLFGAATIEHEPSEVTVMAKLDHPNTAKMFFAWNGSGFDSFGRRSDAFFLSMMLSARTLSCYLHQNPVIDSDTVDRIFLQMLMGLDYIHKHNVVHHDLKPGNILMDDDLSLRISDYGIAAMKGSPNDRFPPDTLGSFPYVAPEVNAAVKCHDEKADIFSCGVIYFEMCICHPRKTKVAAFSRHIREAMKSWVPWLAFDFNAALEGTGLLDGFSGNLGLLEMMVDPNDTKRPSAAEILDILSGAKTSQSLETN